MMAPANVCKCSHLCDIISLNRYYGWYTMAGYEMRVNGNKKGIFIRNRLPKLAAYQLKKRWEKFAFEL